MAVSRRIVHHPAPLLVLLFCLSCFARLALAQPSTFSQKPPGAPLVVVSDDNYPPYIFRDESGELKGILVDQWRAWSDATGRPVELRAMDWSLAQEAIYSGRADVIDTMFRTAEREKRLAFSKPYARLDVPVFFHRDISGIAALSDLQGFRIAVKEGDACIEVLRAAGIVDLLVYPSYSAIVDAAVSGRVKVFSIDRPPALYLLSRAGVLDEYREAFNLYTGEFHRAVLLGDQPLLALVENGFASVPYEVLSGIEERWLGKSLVSSIDRRVWYLVALSFGLLLLVAAVSIIVTLVLRRTVRARTSELAQKVQQLSESQNRIQALLKAVPDLLFVFDNAGRFVELIGDENSLYLPPERFLGCTVGQAFNNPELGERCDRAIIAVRSGSAIETFEYDLELPQGKRDYEARLVPLGPDRVLCVCRDVSERTQKDQALAASLAQKETLLKEVHHRVKNNLQIVSSLLAMQADRIKDDYDRQLLLESQGRVVAMARVHEQLYRTGDFSDIPIHEYTRTLVADLVSAWEGSDGSGQAAWDVDCDELHIPLDKAVPLGLIINELVTNVCKYAFAGNPHPWLGLRIKREQADAFGIEVCDNGKGFPEAFSPELTGGMGFTILQGLVHQLHGSLAVGRAVEGGARVHVLVPVEGGPQA